MLTLARTKQGGGLTFEVHASKKPLCPLKACQGTRKVAVTSKLDDTRTLE